MNRIAVVIAAAMVSLAGCSPAGTTAAGSTGGPAAAPAADSTGGPAAGRVASAGAALHCHSVNGLPDRHCTPGAGYARVTQLTSAAPSA